MAPVAGRGLLPYHQQRNRKRTSAAGLSTVSRTAGRRHDLGLSHPSDSGRAIRADLCQCAEKPRDCRALRGHRSPEPVATAAAPPACGIQLRRQAEQQSRFNTPPTFALYVAGLMLRWIRQNGGLPAMDEAAQRSKPRALPVHRYQPTLSLPTASAGPLGDQCPLPAHRTRIDRHLCPAGGSTACTTCMDMPPRAASGPACITPCLRQASAG